MMKPLATGRELELELASAQLLDPTGLESHHLESILGILSGPSIDFGDIFLESTRSESWLMENNIVKEGAHQILHGGGLRAVSGLQTGFAYSDDLSFNALKNAAKAARTIAAAGETKELRLDGCNGIASYYENIDPIDQMNAEEKVNLLSSINARLRTADSRVIEVKASLSGQYTNVVIATSDGSLVADIRPLVRLNVTVVVEEKGRKETASFGGGGRYSYKNLIGEGNAEKIADEALRQAIVNLSAESAPAGEMIVVLAPGWPGILLHEAIGHGLEGDFNRKKTSAFSGRIGEKIAHESCTVVDDGTLTERRGSISVDDEGTPSSCTTLIENGYLRGYLHDRQNAGLMGSLPTGNGRRQSYAHRPMPRMTNTYMLPGSHHPEEILQSVKKGLYAVSFGGGQVDITNGKFVFSANEAYLIENGKITAPVKGATLIGDGPDVLTKVSMIGNDLKLDSGVGTCGKNGQSVPVGVGQPTLKINSLTVGGTKT
jgi:TldD protein